jgi:hypothetical protein
MKNIKILILINLIFFQIHTLTAQKLLSGSFDFLKGQTEVGLQFDYNDLKIEKLTEGNFIQKQIVRENKRHKGSGEKWLEAWKLDKTLGYQPKFESTLNEITSKFNMVIDPTVETPKYTIIVKTRKIKRGISAPQANGIKAAIDLEIYLVETNNSSNSLGVLLLKKMKSPRGFISGTSIDLRTRVSGAYGTAGKVLGKYIRKKIKKTS